MPFMSIMCSQATLASHTSLRLNGEKRTHTHTRLLMMFHTFMTTSISNPTLLKIKTCLKTCSSKVCRKGVRYLSSCTKDNCPAALFCLTTVEACSLSTNNPAHHSHNTSVNLLFLMKLIKKKDQYSIKTKKVIQTKQKTTKKQTKKKSMQKVIHHSWYIISLMQSLKVQTPSPLNSGRIN